MSLSNFKLFCDVVRSHSFSKGAAINGITQSAASQAINHLEQEMGAQLIDRRKRPFILTTEGEICYEGLCDILTRYETIAASIKSLRQNISGSLRVAAIYSVGLHEMSATMQTFMTRYPRAKVKLQYLLPQKVYQEVLHEGVDLGIVSYPIKTAEIDIIPLRVEKMVLVCHPEHHLAHKNPINIKQLHGENFIAFDRELPIHRELERYFHDSGITVRKVMEFDNIETIKQAIEIGAGLSILPEPTVRSEVARGTLAAVRIQGCNVERPIGIIHRQRKVFTPAMTRFIEMLRASSTSQNASGANAPSRNEERHKSSPS